MGWYLIVSTGLGVEGGRGREMVLLPPMMRAVPEGASEMGVPLTVIAGPPGERVCVAIT